MKKQQKMLAWTYTHYGWIIEVDPLTLISKPHVKHTALGRFNHENAAMGIAKVAELLFIWAMIRKMHAYKFIVMEHMTSLKVKQILLY